MSQMPYFPMFVNLRTKQVLVIGSGEEAIACIRALLACTEQISVIALQEDKDLARLEKEGRIVLLRKEYDREDLFGCDLCVAATDDDRVNNDIHAACKCLGIPVHVCGDATKCDFFFSPVPAHAGSAES